MSQDVEPPKFSRYRSVRKANQDTVSSPPTMPQEPAPAKPETLGRSMSRYRKDRPTTAGNPQLPLGPPKRANTQEFGGAAPAPPLPSNAHATVSRARAATLNSTAHRQQQPSARRGTTTSQRPNIPNLYAPKSPPRTLVEQTIHEPPRVEREQARQILDAEAERQRRINAKIKAEKAAQLEAQEKRRIQAEEAAKLQNAKEQERLRAAQEAQRAQQKLKEEQEIARRRRAQSDVKGNSARSQSRRRVANSPPKESPASPKSDEKDAPQSPSRFKSKIALLRKLNFDEPAKPEPDLHPRTVIEEPPATEAPFIRAGGGGIVPQTDAPISAVNAGDRRVLVECNKSSIKLPVTTTTTPVDLIRSCETVLSENIDLKMSVLLEDFNKVGVQRPLRRYEHIRDVLNSWDDDAQNSLVLVPITHGADEELDEARIPKEQPAFSGYLYYSQRPGKWKKEYIVLRSDGQMTSAKNDTGKDESNMCHLSDFDIYTPTNKKMKNMKPPKKTCFAIKSQQKSNIFSDTSTFVHFFCTNDRDVSSRFYQAVQGWRSWYLVNVMGEGKKEKAALSATPFKLDLDFGDSASKGHTKNASIDSHYQLGTFQPMLDFDTFNDMKFADPILPPLHLAGTTLHKNDSKAMHARKMSMRRNQPPPLSYPDYFSDSEAAPAKTSGLNSLARNAPLSHSKPQSKPLVSLDDDDTFASSGLLGRTYSQRQRLQQKREREGAATATASQGPFTEGPSLMNTAQFNSRTSIDGNTTSNGSSGGLTRQTSVRSNHKRNSSDLRPSASVRRPFGQPLVDLTPQYREPPQHARKGKGFSPANCANLIDNATTPDTPFNIPSTNDWRARQQATRGTGLPASSSALHTQENPHAAERSTDAFTGKGLLASVGPTQGGLETGRGVMDGSKAKGPLVDLGDDNLFSKGTLLNDIERREGPKGPVIDREKRKEGFITTGEGF